MSRRLRLIPPALADDGDPIEEAVWARLRWHGHDKCAKWTWEPDTGLVRCVVHDSKVVGAVNADHPRAMAVGDPHAVTGAIDMLMDAVAASGRHLAPYGNADATAALNIIVRMVGELRAVAVRETA